MEDRRCGLKSRMGSPNQGFLPIVGSCCSTGFDRQDRNAYAPRPTNRPERYTKPSSSLEWSIVRLCHMPVLWRCRLPPPLGTQTPLGRSQRPAGLGDKVSSWRVESELMPTSHGSDRGCSPCPVYTAQILQKPCLPDHLQVTPERFLLAPPIPSMDNHHREY